jgi:hypothetical protein
MKKNLLIIGLLLAMSLGVSAQNTGFAFGLKLGPGFDWTGSTTGAAKSEGVRTGFGVGLVAEYYFAENYAIVTGVNVNMNRGHYSFQNAHLDSVAGVSPFSVDRYYKSTVYEIPLMLKMVTNELGNLPLRVYAQVGAGFGYAQKVKVKDSYEDFNGDTYIASNKEYSNFRTSLKIGAGAQYALDESTRVFLGVYFSHDFINNINSIAPNHYKFYFDGDEKVGERDPKLNVLQNRVGIEAGVLF